MKACITMLLVLALCGCHDRVTPRPKELTNCSIGGSGSNSPHFQDMTETYHCDQEDIVLHGKWGMTVEYGTIYNTNMGRVSEKTEQATEFDRDFYQWCRKDERQLVLCGAAVGQFNAPLSAMPWYPNADDYPEVR